MEISIVKMNLSGENDELLVNKRKRKQRNRDTASKPVHPSKMSYVAPKSFDTNSDEGTNDVDIVIIGAGLAGLTAAYSILKKNVGLSVLVLEANGEIGGRVLPKEFSIAYHANFLQKHITELLEDLEILIYRTPLPSKKREIFLTKDGPVECLSPFYGAQVHYLLRQLHHDSLNPIFDTYTRNESTVRLATSSTQQLLSQYVFSSRSRSICAALIYSLCGVRNTQNISALYLLVLLNGSKGLYNRLRIAIGDENRYYVQGGMKNIVEKLANYIIEREGGNIRLNESVIQIQFNQDRAYVMTTQNCVKCDYVIIAVPPPESSHIVIDPSLPKYLTESQTKYCHGKNAFFTATYEQPFLRDTFDGDVIATSDSNTSINLIYNATRTNSAVSLLAGYLNNRKEIQNANLELFQILIRCFGIESVKSCKKYIDWNWASCETNLATKYKTGGGGSPMSVLKPTNISFHINLMTMSQRSEYAFNWAGTADGAIEAGKRTAYSVLLRSRPQTLNIAEILSSASQTRIMRVKEPFTFEMFVVKYILAGINILIFFNFLSIKV